MKFVKYEKDQCPGCVNAKKFMDDNEIQYKTFNISHDSTAKEKLKKWNIMSVPMIAIENEETNELVKCVIGFDPMGIMNLWEEFQKIK